MGDVMRLDATFIALGFVGLAACASGADPSGDTLDPTFGDQGDDTTGDGDGDGDGDTGDGDGDGDGDTGDGDGDGDAGACGNGQIEPGEDCDSGDLGDQSCMTQGFGGGGLACNDDCTYDTTNCNSCGNGMVDEDEECDGEDLGMSSTCADLGLGGANEPLGCTPACMYDFNDCSGCGDGVVTAPEQCEPAGDLLEKAELDGQSCMSLGFDDGLLDCTQGCTFDTDSCYECGDAVQQGQEECDGADFDAAMCSDYNSMSGDPFASGSLSCEDDCTISTDNCALCGDSVISGSEVCDPGDLGGETCQTQGFDGGSLSCNNDCSGFDESNCTDCGDGMIEGAEECDFNNLGGETCISQGFPGGGDLLCTLDCVLDTGMCANNFCGDGQVNGMDQCDCGNQGQNCTAAQLGNQNCIGLGFDGGSLACNSPNNCNYNTSGCYECGDGNIDPGEQCDSNDLAGETCISQGFPGGGQLSCDNNCGLDTSACVNVGNPFTICTSPNLGIVSNATVASMINVPDNGTITDVNLYTDILHTWVGDVDFTLSHAGSTPMILDRPGQPGSLYGCANANIDATFDDEGPGDAENTCDVGPAILSPPNYSPVNPLSVFDGQNMSGTWTLAITDNVGGDEGTLLQWCLTIAWQ